MSYLHIRGHRGPAYVTIIRSCLTYKLHLWQGTDVNKCWGVVVNVKHCYLWFCLETSFRLHAPPSLAWGCRAFCIYSAWCWVYRIVSQYVVSGENKNPCPCRESNPCCLAHLQLHLSSVFRFPAPWVYRRGWEIFLRKCVVLTLSFRTNVCLYMAFFVSLATSTVFTCHIPPSTQISPWVSPHSDVSAWHLVLHLYFAKHGLIFFSIWRFRTLTSLSLLIPEVTWSHTMTHQSR
jgi:hypothetical protein